MRRAGSIRLEILHAARRYMPPEQVVARFRHILSACKRVGPAGAGETPGTLGLSSSPKRGVAPVSGGRTGTAGNGDVAAPPVCLELGLTVFSNRKTFAVNLRANPVRKVVAP